MAVKKTEVVSVRVPPDVKAALVAAAAEERRSLASMIEVMVLGYCQSRSIDPGPRRAAVQAQRATNSSTG